CLIGGCIIWPLRDPSISARYGALMYVVYAIPVALAAWVGWLLLTPFLGWPARRIGLFVVIALAWVYPTLLRLDGTTSDIKVTVNFRWKPTPEELFLAEKKTPPELAGAKAGAETLMRVQSEDWPGFRGLERDSRRAGQRISTDWKQKQPREVWQKRVGP